MIPFYKKPVFELPDGPKNLSALFPAIDWSQVEEYSVSLKTTGDAVLVTTAKQLTGCCCNEDVVRLHFENYLGRWDAVNFDRVSIVHEASSAEYKKPLPDHFTKTDTGTERFSVRSGDIYTASTTCYPEEAMAWLMELADTKKALMEWKGIEGQADSFLPVVVLDGKYDKKKSTDDRYIYVFTIQFKMSNEIIQIRN